MVDSFAKLSDSMKLMENVGKIFEGWGLIFDGITSAVDKMGKGEMPGPGLTMKEATFGFKEMMKDLLPGKVSMANPLPTKQDINVNLNQNFNNPDISPQDVGRAAKDGVSSAYRNIPIQSN